MDGIPARIRQSNWLPAIDLELPVVVWHGFFSSVNPYNGIPLRKPPGSLMRGGMNRETDTV